MWYQNVYKFRNIINVKLDKEYTRMSLPIAQAIIIYWSYKSFDLDIKTN